MAEITLEPGSAAHRFALHLLAKPADYGRHAIAPLLGVAPGAVDSLLQTAVDQGVVTIGANADQGGRVWRAGPRLAGWHASAGGRPAALRPAPAAPAPAPAAAADKPAASRGGSQPPLPRLDLDKLKVSTSMPLPSAQLSRKGATRYDSLLDKLTADGMSVTGGIPRAYQSALMKAAVAYLAARPTLKATSTFYVRRLEDKPDEIGVWRVARTGPDALPRTRLAATKHASTTAAR